MNEEMQQYAIPVDGRNLGWAKSAYTMNGVPIVQIVALGDGTYAIVIMATPGNVPDWRTLRTYKRPPIWQRIDVARFVPWLLALAVVAGIGWVLVNGLPAAVAEVLPDVKIPAVELPAMPSIQIPGIELPDIGGAVENGINNAMRPLQEAVDTGMRVVAGVLTLAVGLVVLWLLWTFRGTIGGIGQAAYSAARRVKK